MPKFNNYYLAKWSAYVRNRDDMTCCMCKRTVLKRREVRQQISDITNAPLDIGDKFADIAEVNGLLGEAHHAYAKYHYPEKAYDLDNGVTLCWRCHRAVVHSTYETFRMYIFMFRCMMRRKLLKSFNTKYQKNVQPKT